MVIIGLDCSFEALLVSYFCLLFLHFSLKIGKKIGLCIFEQVDKVEGHAEIEFILKADFLMIDDFVVL